MAEVLTLSLQSPASITMMHTRPSSADAFQQTSSQPYAQSARLVQQQQNRNAYATSGYRGTAAPVQPYAFQATPTLRPDSSKSLTAPAAPHGPSRGHKHIHAQSISASSTNSSDTASNPSAKDDSVIGSRNGSFINLSSAVPDLSLTSYDSLAKPSPDRYRRPGTKRVGSTDNVSSERGSAPPSGSGMASVSHLIPAQQSAPVLPLVLRQDSADDSVLSGKISPSDLPNRYRRRSLNTLDTSAFQLPPTSSQRPYSAHGATSTPTAIRPASSHDRSGSDDSQRSFKATGVRPAGSESSNTYRTSGQGVIVPPRTASTDATKRMVTPSPLSKQSTETDAKPRTYAAAAQSAIKTPSPAAQHLAAVSDRDLNKGMKSRLRRAFSFGSAQELRRGAAENSASNAGAPFATATANEQTRAGAAMDDELDDEQQEIARRQEAAGMGASIYSGQGGFTGSTDNLSISSTASSASLMLRKMGRGAKKGAKSIKGLFRPKSVIGVPAADGPVRNPAPLEPSLAQVSMVTVEAERQKVNVNAHASDKHDGITGYPRLERNSLDASTLTVLPPPSRGGSADGADANPRQSIVGSDKERAEVLAAVKKGILKRSGTASPTGSPSIRPNELPLTRIESPNGSIPATPKDARSAVSMNHGQAQHGDYFTASRQFASKSMPNTPGGSRNISFSPRIQFHDAWSASEYDRRGEIATCNRLTPMLAQQIKEELNTFKMEMEVHELSKPHTHFF